MREDVLRAIVKQMPKCWNEVDALLRALADPTRRGVAKRLARGPAVVSELAAPSAMTPPALLQHLGILEQADLITSEKVGGVRTVTLRPGALDVLHRAGLPGLAERAVGGVRRGGAQALPIGIKALGSNPRKSAKDGIGELDEPVEIAGVVFAPGRHVWADADGILVER